MADQVLEHHGNQVTFNLEKVLQAQLENSAYYKTDLQQYDRWNELIDEIYDQVDHVEPWLSGNARGPSTAFTLLYRLFHVPVTERDMRAITSHKDSPYIRAVGFLYLRYVGDPKRLWDWYGRHVDDPDEFAPGASGRMTTIGAFVRDLILDQYYFETLLPRLPELVRRDMTARLAAKGLPTTPLGGGGTGLGNLRTGDEQVRRPPSVKAALAVAMGQKAPHRAGAKDDGRAHGGASGAAPRPRDDSRPAQEPRREDRGREEEKASRDRERERERERDRGGDRGRDRDWGREGGRHSRSRSRSRDGRDDRGGREDRGAARHGGDRDRRRGRDDSRSRSRSRDRGHRR